MELRQLEYFMMLCEELHFTRAAEKLHIAQPTLSQQIKILEEEVGVLLFNRIGKKISLTVAGQLLYTQSLTIFQTIQNTKHQLQELSTLQKGILRIGATPGELTNFISKVLLDFMQEYPAVQVSVISTDDVYTLLKENKIDLGFSFSQLVAHDGQFCEVSLFSEPLYFVVHKEHTLATREAIELQDLIQEKLVLFPTQHLCRKLIDQALKQEHLMFQPAFETASIPVIFEFVEKQLGGTIVARTLYQLHKTPQIVAKPIASGQLKRETVLIFQKEAYMPQVARAFIAILQKALIRHSVHVSPEGKAELAKL
ncbi:MAG: LysR family transcriptional regulator [Solibacillus sp.]